MTRTFAMTALCAAACIPCSAQHAVVVVSHNDPDGIVSPGEIVQISATVSWTGAWLLEEIMGDVRSSSDAGIASNSMFPHSWYASNQATIVNPGVPDGGSMLGMHLRSYGAFWITLGLPAMPWSLANGFEVLRFDWTAPTTPGVVEFDFIPDPFLPLPTFRNNQNLNPYSLPTTFVGTSLTVIPAPGAGLVLAAGLAGWCFRHRRGRR